MRLSPLDSHWLEIHAGCMEQAPCSRKKSNRIDLLFLRKRQQQLYDPHYLGGYTRASLRAAGLQTSSVTVMASSGHQHISLRADT